MTILGGTPAVGAAGMSMIGWCDWSTHQTYASASGWQAWSALEVAKRVQGMP